MTPSPTKFATALRAIFAQHLPLTRGLSPRTVLSYRDSFVLLLRFLAATAAVWLISNSSTYGLEMFLRFWNTLKQSGRIASPLATPVWPPFMPLRASWRREILSPLKSASDFWLYPPSADQPAL